MKKILLCLLLMGITAVGAVHITKNWDTITGVNPPTQNEIVQEENNNDDIVNDDEINDDGEIALPEIDPE